MILFEWDERKAASNLKKHGVSFEDATRIFDDPELVEIPDRVVEGEQRWQAVGRVSGIVLLLVAHAVREHGSSESIRIISARRASRREALFYQGEID